MLRRLPLSKYGRIARCLLSNLLTDKPFYPFYASFKLTSRCHFACAFCNIKDEHRPDLPTERVKRILDNLSDSSVALVSFEGGEPLLRSDIGELLEYARSKDFYLLFTTSERKLEHYPMKAYARYIDFLHISIDEGHNNLQMFDRLEEFARFGTRLSIQVVVTRDTLQWLEEKVRRCAQAGANMVVMPAVHMNRTEDRFPDLDRFQAELGWLKQAYPGIIYTPDGYFERVKKRRCSPESIIIDSTGELFYPCHILEKKGPDLSEQSLMDYLVSPEAHASRREMARCEKGCGWFQYFSIGEFTSIKTALRSLMPFRQQRLRYTPK